LLRAIWASVKTILVLARVTLSWGKRRPIDPLWKFLVFSEMEKASLFEFSLDIPKQYGTVLF